MKIGAFSDFEKSMKEKKHDVFILQNNEYIKKIIMKNKDSVRVHLVFECLLSRTIF